MLYAGRAFYGISPVNDSYWPSPFLIVASAFRDEQNLTAGMNMPIQLCAGIINGLSNTGIEGAVSGVELTQPDIPCVIPGSG